MRANRKVILALLFFLVFVAGTVLADAPPDPGGGPGGGDGPVGGGSPVDGGSLMFLVYGLLYLGKRNLIKIKNLWKR